MHAHDTFNLHIATEQLLSKRKQNHIENICCVGVTKIKHIKTKSSYHNNNNNNFTLLAIRDS